MKKIISVIAALTLAFFAATLPCCAENLKEIKAKSAILVEPKTGTVVYEQNADQKLPEASVTKIMTILLVIEAIEEGRLNLTDEIVCSDFAASMGGSQIWLEPGERMTVDELLKATVVASANDAAVALGEAVSGTNEAFINLMNERAQQLGMTNTVYKNCTGLHDNGHYTTARDISVVTAELLRHELIFNYTTIWMDTLRGGETQLVNTNKLLRTYQGITGMKTGTTSQAGKCLSATATRGNLSFVAVILGSETGDDRFNGAKKLLDYGFTNYEMTTPSVDESLLTNVSVNGGMEKSVAVTCAGFDEILIPAGKSESVITEVKLADDVAAPVEKGQTVGYAVVYLNGNELARCDVKTAQYVNKITVGRVFKTIFYSLFNIQVV